MAEDQKLLSMPMEPEIVNPKGKSQASRNRYKKEQIPVIQCVQIIRQIYLKYYKIW